MQLEAYLNTTLKNLSRDAKTQKSYHQKLLAQARRVRAQASSAPLPISFDLFERTVITQFGTGKIHLRQGVVFLYFAALHRLEAIRRDQAMKDLYNDIGGPKILAQSIDSIRQVCHEPLADPTYFQTLPRFGYTFNGSLTLSLLQQPVGSGQAAESPTGNQILLDWYEGTATGEAETVPLLLSVLRSLGLLSFALIAAGHVTREMMRHLIQANPTSDNTNHYMSSTSSAIKKCLGNPKIKPVLCMPGLGYVLNERLKVTHVFNRTELLFDQTVAHQQAVEHTMRESGSRRAVL